MDNSLLHRKDSLILTAVEVIDELGIQGMSTREIAKRQGVSEATLFRHYKSKSELLLAVLDYYKQFDSDIYKSTMLKELSPMEAIFYITNCITEYYQNYPAITSISQIYEVLFRDPVLKDKIKEILEQRNNIISQLVEEAKIKGEIKKDVNTQALADMIMGLFSQICLKWRLNNFSFSLKESILSSLSLLLDQFKL